MCDPGGGGGQQLVLKLGMPFPQTRPGRRGGTPVYKVYKDKVFMIGKETRTKQKRRMRRIGGHAPSPRDAEGAAEGNGAGLHRSSSSAARY
eukprot:1141544-Pelagomonas_calceolata.AAC.2